MTKTLNLGQTAKQSSQNLTFQTIYEDMDRKLYGHKARLIVGPIFKWQQSDDGQECNWFLTVSQSIYIWYVQATQSMLPRATYNEHVNSSS